jgi:hypothetical protein
MQAEEPFPGGNRIVDRFARALLVLLAVLLPFEVPLFRVGPLQITTVELALYAALAAWGIARSLAWMRDPSTVSSAMAALRRETVVQAVLLWTAVTFASAVTAPSYRMAAIKFALRSLSGVLVFFAARSLARHRGTDRLLVGALLVGAALSAATAMVDSLVPASGPLWDLFRAGRFTALGLPRASGVFAYPTIGAMYWEAAVPLLVVVPSFVANAANAKVPGRVPSAMMVAVALGAALFVEAILASATRSALFGAAAGAGAMFALGRRSSVPVRNAAALTMAVLVVSAAIPFAASTFGSLLGQRLRFWQDDSWFRAEYQVGTAPRTVSIGQVFSVPLTVRNTGTLTWTAEGEHPFRLGSHWAEPGSAMSHANFEGMRTDLPADVPPGALVEVRGLVRAPAEEGAYRLRWDLVQEGVTWFSERGNATPEVPIEVVSGTAPALPETVADRAAQRPAAPPPPSRPALWRAAVVLWRARPILGIGPDNFRRRYGAVLSPSPAGQPYEDERIHANSLYFETLADLGVAGLAALAMLGLALVRLARDHAKAGRFLALACSVGAGTFFVHGVLDYFMEFTPLFGLFWMLLGLAAAFAVPPQAEGPQGTTR